MYSCTLSRVRNKLSNIVLSIRTSLTAEFCLKGKDGTSVGSGAGSSSLRSSSFKIDDFPFFSNKAFNLLVS
jgi:hypothetical protein